MAGVYAERLADGDDAPARAFGFRGYHVGQISMGAAQGLAFELERGVAVLNARATARAEAYAGALAAGAHGG